MSASSFWTFRERSSVPEASRAGEPSETPCQRLGLPKLHPLAPPSLALTRLPSENPADDSLLLATLQSLISTLAVGASIRDRGAILLQPSLAAGILKPSLALMGVIQDTSLNDTHKGREEFSETHMQRSAWIISPNRFCGAHPYFRVSKPVLHVMVRNGYSLR
jgi:hypothetical protein